jgi:hypothetical protein
MHNTATKTAELDLSTYSGAMLGGEDGAVIVPGDPDNSLLIRIQTSPHFRNVTPEEMILLEQWISAGALER